MNTEKKYKKVLIMTIGTGSTGADIAHGLFFSIKDSNPNLLILIGSEKSFEITLPHLKNLIAQEDLNLEILEKLIEEVNDFEFLHFEYSKIINELLKQGYSINKINVDYTSGTKAMSAALVSAAIEAKVGSILYVYGERGEGGRVKSGTERRNSLSPNKLYSQDFFQKAVDLFNAYRYTNCIELLSSYEFHPEFLNKVNLLHNLAKIFDAWDKFSFSAAFEIARHFSLEELKEFNLKGKFEKDYLPLLVKLKETHLSIEKVFDLIENANRRASEGRFDDAVARLYRALEMIGQIEFEKEFKCPTSNVNVENIPEEFRADINKHYYDLKDGKIKIPLFAVFDLLAKINNKIGLQFNNNLEQNKKILSQRNNSILAHGAIPLTEDNYNEAFMIITKLFESISISFNTINFPKIK